MILSCYVMRLMKLCAKPDTAARHPGVSTWSGESSHTRCCSGVTRQAEPVAGRAAPL
jgi:hypothetical protein